MFPKKNKFQLEERISSEPGITNILSKNLEDLYEERRSTLRILPSVSRKVLLLAQHLNGCCLAGGAALELYTGDVNKIKDWDLFFTDRHSLNAAVKEFEKLGFEFTGSSDWSLTYEFVGVVVQFINRRYYQSVSQIFSGFDFSVCCFAINGPNIEYAQRAIEDVENKQINFIATDDIVMCVKRIGRYGKKGYTPTNEFVKSLMRKIYTIDIDKVEDGNYSSS